MLSPDSAVTPGAEDRLLRLPGHRGTFPGALGGPSAVPSARGTHTPLSPLFSPYGPGRSPFVSPAFAPNTFYLRETQCPQEPVR